MIDFSYMRLRRSPNSEMEKTVLQADLVSWAATLGQLFWSIVKALGMALFPTPVKYIIDYPPS